jgi:hypothetical protein
MGEERFELTRAERASYFAPTAICGYLTALCLALVATSAFLRRMPGAIALTAVGILGGAFAGGLGIALYALQQRDRRYAMHATGRAAQANYAAAEAAMRDAGWEITASVPGERLEARTIGSMMLAGERIAVRFAGTRVWVASICDPGVGFSLPGRRRCERHRALVLGAVGATTRP